MNAKRKQLHWSLVPKPQYPSLHKEMLSPAGMTKIFKFKPLQGDLPEAYYSVYFDRSYIPAYIQYKPIKLNF
jgi:hypothetical protein